MFKSIKSLFVANFIGKILGFVREIFLAYAFGTNVVIDFFKLCNSLILTPLNLFVGNSLQQILIPLYQKKKDKIVFAKIISVLILLVSLILCISTIIFSKEIIDLFLENTYSSSERAVATKFLIIFSLGIPFYVFNWIFIYILNANKNFKENGMNVLNFNAVMIGITLLYFLWKNIYILPLSFLVANILIVFQLIAKYRQNVKNAMLHIYKYHLKGFFGESKTFVLMWSPLLVYALFMQIYSLVERWFLSKGTGLVAASDYARMITETPVFLVTLPLATVGLTYFSKSNREIFSKIMQIFLFVIFGSVILSLYIYLNQQIIVKLMFMRGNFDSHSLHLVTSLLQFYSIGFCFYSINTFLYRIYNAEIRNRELSTIVIAAHFLTFITMILLYNFNIKVNVIVGICYIIVNALQSIALIVRSGFFHFNLSWNNLKVFILVILPIVLMILIKSSEISDMFFFLISTVIFFIVIIVSLMFLRRGMRGKSQ